MEPRSAEQAGGGRGLLDGVMPAVLAAVVFLVGIALTVVARIVSAPHGFDLEQPVVEAVLAATIVGAAVAYTVACVRARSRVRTLASAGSRSRVVGLLWGLAVTALLVLLPIVVAALYPQHPAP